MSNKYNTIEFWTPLIYKDQKTRYSISCLGNVRNNKTGRILKQFVQNDGYYGFTISLNNKPHSIKTAKAVATHFIYNDNPSEKTQVNHIKGKNKDDNSVFNLEWVTPKENKNDAIKQGLYTPLCGTKNPNAIYTEKQIRHVCKLFEENKLDICQIMKKTGVNKEAIFAIHRGIRWISISKDYKISNYNKIPANPNKKNSEEVIRSVCELIDKYLSTKEIVSKTGVGKDTVKRLRSCKIFKNIICDYNFYKLKFGLFND